MSAAAMVILQPGVKVEGPPPGAASGRFDVPRWAIGVLGGTIIGLGVLYLVIRLIATRGKP